MHKLAPEMKMLFRLFLVLSTFLLTAASSKHVQDNNGPYHDVVAKYLYCSATVNAHQSDVQIHKSREADTRLFYLIEDTEDTNTNDPSSVNKQSSNNHFVSFYEDILCINRSTKKDIGSFAHSTLLSFRRYLKLRVIRI